MATFRRCWLVCILFVAFVTRICGKGVSDSRTGSNPVAIRVSLGGVINEVLPEYVSADIDWWHCTPGATSQQCLSGGQGWANASVLTVNLDDPLLRAAAAALSPGLLRIGGSEDDVVRYQMGGESARDCHSGAEFRHHNVSLCLTPARWDAVNAFAEDAGLRLVFGVSYFTDANREWASDNVAALLNYTAAKNHSLYGIELGEEMAPTGEGFDALIRAYRTAHTLLQQAWPNAASRPLLMGPCDGMANEDPESKGFAWMKEFLGAALPSHLLDAVCVHSYNNDGGDGWQRPGFLNQTLRQAKAMMAETRKYSATAMMFCGECGPHNGGGLPNVTDRAISSFWYADALGSLAALGYKEMGRQSLVGANYGLLHVTSHLPNPDFYIAALWTKLMGTAVLGVSVTAGHDSSLHAYAHCARTGSGEVALVMVNVDPTQSFAVTMQNATQSGKWEIYELAPAGGDVLSKFLLLNGRALKVEGASLPDLSPTTQPASLPLVVQPLTVVFAVLSGVAQASCA